MSAQRLNFAEIELAGRRSGKRLRLTIWIYVEAATPHDAQQALEDLETPRLLHDG